MISRLACIGCAAGGIVEEVDVAGKRSTVDIESSFLAQTITALLQAEWLSPG